MLKMKGKILIALVVLVSAIVGYYATLPVPDDLPNPYTLRANTAFRDIMAFIYLSLPMNARDALDRLLPITPPPGFNVTEASLDGIPAIFYRPLVGDSRPLSALVFVHGGGWMLGSIYQIHDMASNIAVSLGNSVIISVGYRLAPKHIFPAAIDDVTKATVWLLGHSDQLNIDPNRIVIMGESAGGNLAAAVSQRLTFDTRYKNLPKLKAQVLLNPSLQMFDLKTPSNQQNGRYSTLILDRYWMARMWNNYLAGNEALVSTMLDNKHTSTEAKISVQSQLISHDLIPQEFKMKNYFPTDTSIGDEHVYNQIKEIMLNPDFSPLMRPLLSGLPEAYILTCEYDILRDDGILYAKRLEADGVKTTWKNDDKGIHGKFQLVLSQPPPPNGTYDDDTIVDIFHFLKDAFK